MRKLFTLSLFVFSCFILLGQSTLPNGDFESWIWEVHPTHPNGGYYEPAGDFFSTLNILDTIALPPGLTCYPTDNAHSGDSAVHLITRSIDLMQILIPGAVGTIKIKWLSMNAELGISYIYTTKPSRFQGWYQSFPLNGDSTGAVLLLSKWNGTKRDTIAYNMLVFYGTVDEYTEFDVAVNYWNTTDMPDSITVLLLSCAGYNASNMMASVGQVGSEAYFDDVTLTDINGFGYLLMPEVGIKLSPNPVTDILTVALSKPVANGTFEIITTQGKQAGMHRLNDITSRIFVGELPSGAYYYKVSDGKSVLNTGSFIIVK
jgi:hypothetical protein